MIKKPFQTIIEQEFGLDNSKRFEPNACCYFFKIWPKNTLLFIIKLVYNLIQKRLVFEWLELTDENIISATAGRYQQSVLSVTRKISMGRKYIKFCLYETISAYLRPPDISRSFYHEIRQREHRWI